MEIESIEVQIEGDMDMHGSCDGKFRLMASPSDYQTYSWIEQICNDGTILQFNTKFVSMIKYKKK